MLTVRTLLEMREHCMSEFEFYDVYSREKREENKLGLELFAARCAHIARIEDIDKRWHELFKGLLAGNVYDYGAQAFIQKQQRGDVNTFDKAIEIIDGEFASLHVQPAKLFTVPLEFDDVCVS